MIKIKDNTDLKELEKFGFKNNEEFYEIGELFRGLIEIPIKSRYLEIYYCENMKIDIEDIIFELTQAGLVEKVGE